MQGSPMKMNSDTLAGIIATVAFHAALLVVTVSGGLSYTFPPPPEKSIVMEFEPEEEPRPVIEERAGKEPQAQEPDVTKPVKLVQKSEAPVHKGTKENVSKETTVGDKGDVEVPEPPRKKEINQRALFSAANNSKKDTLAPQTAEAVSDALNAGHAAGNTKSGNIEGQPSAKLAGRNALGELPRPTDNVKEEGTVTVKIFVDRQGNVTSTLIKSSTSTNSKLMSAAMEAAKKTKFNPDPNAPEIQEGTITYKYRLK